jgi:hypothetical protein
MATKDNMTIGLTGSQEPDNFTIQVYQWDVASSAESLRVTYATGVTRNTPSTYGGGTLALGTYGITGITGSDYYIKLTATNKCGSSAVYAVNTTTLALTVLNQVPLSTVFGAANPDSMIFTGPPMSLVTNGARHSEIAYFDGPFYLSDNPPVYPQYGAGGTGFTTNFTIEHLGTYLASDGSTVSGKWGNGPFDTYLLTQDQSSPYKRYSIDAFQTAGIAIDLSPVDFKSQIRVTFNPSGSSRTFYYYWYGSNV